MLDEDADLNWLDYGFRNYDPQIGRFPQLDPLTDDYPFLTPYQYASCDPINNIDIDGLEGTAVNAGDFAWKAAGTTAFDAVNSFGRGFIMPATRVATATSVASTASKSTNILSLIGSITSILIHSSVTVGGTINVSMTSAQVGQKPYKTTGVNLESDEINYHRDRLNTEVGKSLFESFWNHEGNVTLSKDEFKELEKVTLSSGFQRSIKDFVAHNKDKNLAGTYVLKKYSVVIDNTNGGRADVTLVYKNNKLVGVFGEVFFYPSDEEGFRGDPYFMSNEGELDAYSKQGSLRTIKFHAEYYPASFDEVPVKQPQMRVSGKRVKYAPIRF